MNVNDNNYAVVGLLIIEATADFIVRDSSKDISFPIGDDHYM